MAWSHSRATAYCVSGDSPSVNSASWQPASAPFSATSTTCSGDMYGAARFFGGCANVQYQQPSRQSCVSGMKTFGENVIRCGMHAQRGKLG